ncbi:DUF3375 domain-containing protein [Kitasatospora cheerisanensis]|uniref:DUF3375 domain-containing protein n=1 Tax=Kitasatospora cheerisanensis KCTC 2395 TaxID=1348663 RepID=A0A066Z695_9ACTN|nr:DUF3375 domain-containing protein [Kitasatospora cheerisanensis]KDN85866.1 hypothetical protein KCH_23820 [Kitasatospora cheerisanensis KCTC 2395]
MEFDDVTGLFDHPAWRLLRADNAALVLAFCGTVFVDENARGVPEGVLISRLDDQLYDLNERQMGSFPRAASAYLTEWTNNGWLRKYYPPGEDEPHFDATSAVEKAVAWVRALPARSFIGTESRLSTIIDLLHQMAFGTETDPQARIDELSRERDLIDAQIEQLRTGEVEVLSQFALLDRYQQVESTATELLRDFREVEANLRELDRRLRQDVATAEGSKGELLASFLMDREMIAESDQGRSFQAFFDYLLSPRRQEELRELLEQVNQLPQLDGKINKGLLKVPRAWLEAAESTQNTVRQLTEQLRRFLADRGREEDRRVLALVRSVQRHVAVLDDRRDLPGMALEVPQVELVLPMERRLYKPVERVELDSTASEAFDEADVDVSELFAGVHVDEEALAAQVLAVLGESPSGQASLAAVVDCHPLALGLAELLTYFQLDRPGLDVVINPEHGHDLVYERVDTPGRTVATVPQVTFVLNEGGTAAGEVGQA